MPSGVYPADKLQPDDQPIGSGPYKLVKYQPGVQTVLERNDSYWGEKAKNARVLIQYYKDTPALKLAIQGGDVDIAFRNLTPTDISSLPAARAACRWSRARASRSGTWCST